MLKESNYEQDPNETFDDVTHWLGYLSRKDNDSTECTTECGDRRELESDILSEELGT